MAEDFLNGLNIVPLDAKTAKQWIQSVTTSPVDHPWSDLIQKRVVDPLPEAKIPPEAYRAPPYYAQRVREPRVHVDTRPVFFKGRQIPRQPVMVKPKPSFAHETIRMSDVETFRAATAKKVPRSDVNHNVIADLSAVLSGLSTSTFRSVIYRYIDVIKSSMALLEAIHFDLFMPDRSDLRFLGIPLNVVPSGAIEGDYFRVPDADLLSNPSFAVKLGRENYPVVWEARRVEKMTFLWDRRSGTQNGLAYVLNKTANNPGAVMALSEISDRDFPIRETLFPDADSKREHSLVRVTMSEMGTAQIYAVEPPIPGPEPPKEEEKKDGEQGDIAGKEKEKKEEKEVGKDTADKDKKKKEKCKKKGKIEKKKNGKRKKEKEDKKEEEEEEKQFDSRSEYLKRVSNVRTSSQRFGRVAIAVRELDARTADRIEDRLGAFTTYGKEGDLELMDQLFRLGSRYRELASSGVDAKDAGEMRIDESVILKTLMDEKIGNLYHSRPLMDWIYGRKVLYKENGAPEASLFKFGSLQLNAQQSRAIRLYTDENGPRVFCILSPPGSGKTTVAAAMAAAARIVRDEPEPPSLLRQRRRPRREEDVQLLLSVQNVAVDNMGAALKKMNYGGEEVYNMKSTKKLDPHNPAPFDFLDLLEKSKLEEWKKGTMKLTRKVLKNRKELDQARRERRREEPEYEEKKMSYEDCLTFDRREYENGISPKILLSTVEMVLQKFYTHGSLREELENVTRVIIDEASLLTEAALFGIIRRFPQAKIVLIGDEKQLPPFMYDSNILGHELAGRPALTVAMKTGRVPVVELNEVYRAPPSLVAPYNRLAYGGKLVSKKVEGRAPLSEIGLIHSGQPQLLLIDVDGIQERNENTMSLYNKKEIEVLRRLLKKFPKGWKNGIMIICLYKEQKRRLQSVLDKEYTILTVDSAQGKEKEIVILMTTRTQIPKQGTFFDSTERCNVAVSRQQMGLIILGKASLLTTNKPWSTVVNGDDFTQIKADGI